MIQISLCLPNVEGFDSNKPLTWEHYCWTCCEHHSVVSNNKTADIQSHMTMLHLRCCFPTESPPDLFQNIQLNNRYTLHKVYYPEWLLDLSLYMHVQWCNIVNECHVTMNDSRSMWWPKQKPVEMSSIFTFHNQSVPRFSFSKTVNNFKYLLWFLGKQIS